MLYIILISSGVLVIAAISASRWAKGPVRVTCAWAIGLAVVVPGLVLMAAPMLFMMSLGAFLAPWLQAILVCGGLLVASLLHCGRRAVIPVSILSVVIAQGVVCESFARRYQAEKEGYDRLRERYAFESLEARLPRPVPPSVPNEQGHVTGLEGTIEQMRYSPRFYLLLSLHEGTVTRFADTMGFGVGRMPRMGVAAEELEQNRRGDPSPQPDYFSPTLADAKEACRPDAKVFEGLHEAGFLDFVNPAGFGYVKDRRHVAGFQPHGFTKVPGPVERWEVARLELLGLLKHERPVVYQSQKLPRMDELKDAPTRPLDAFEETALEKLRNGADLHVSDGEPVRFVGAVRSTKQCVECHGGQRGALLGAFTYRLRPVQ